MLIAVDHGNKQIKTVHCPPFVSGLAESTQKPFGKDVLSWQNKFYTLSGHRIPYHKNKTEDDRFFVLTLFAIANELLAKNVRLEGTIPIQLAIGLPPAHYGAQNRAFTDYFSGRGTLQFGYRGRLFTAEIDTAQCYPQAYSAAVMMFSELVAEPRVLIVDIGGFTADYLLMRRGQADLSVCDSLENGVILLYNRIKARVSAEHDLLLDEADTDAILKGRGLSAAGHGNGRADGAGFCQRPVQQPAGADAGAFHRCGGIRGRRRGAAAPADRGVRQGRQGAFCGGCARQRNGV